VITLYVVAHALFWVAILAAQIALFRKCEARPGALVFSVGMLAWSAWLLWSP
jgi:hypothetical protein